VRKRFLSRNGRGAYIDFDNSADRQNQGQGRELIRGRGAAKNPNESRDLSYSCVVAPAAGEYSQETISIRQAGIVQTSVAV